MAPGGRRSGRRGRNLPGQDPQWRHHCARVRRAPSHRRNRRPRHPGPRGPGRWDRTNHHPQPRRSRAARSRVPRSTDCAADPEMARRERDRRRSPLQGNVRVQGRKRPPLRTWGAARHWPIRARGPLPFEGQRQQSSYRVCTLAREGRRLARRDPRGRSVDDASERRPGPRTGGKTKVRIGLMDSTDGSGAEAIGLASFRCLAPTMRTSSRSGAAFAGRKRMEARKRGKNR